jgi:hypothetical protein
MLTPADGSAQGRLSLAEVFAHFPVAVFLAGEEG